VVRKWRTLWNSFLAAALREVEGREVRGLCNGPEILLRTGCSQ
jgi:hypothetical protein